MGFRRSDLQEAFFVPGTHAFRVYGYGTTDPLEEVLAPGYFAHGTGLLRPGDLIYVSSCPAPAQGGTAPGGPHMALVMARPDERNPAHAAGSVRLVQDFGRASDPAGCLPARQQEQEARDRSPGRELRCVCVSAPHQRGSKAGRSGCTAAPRPRLNCRPGESGDAGDVGPGELVAFEQQWLGPWLWRAHRQTLGDELAGEPGWINSPNFQTSAEFSGARPEFGSAAECTKRYTACTVRAIPKLLSQHHFSPQSTIRG
jgi:hypothetical protein